MVLALANGINNSGEVVGYDVLDDFTHAAVWKKGRTVQLPQANAYGWGQAISDDGTVVGGNPQPGGTGIVNQAALWRNGRYLDLQPTGTCYGPGIRHRRRRYVGGLASATRRAAMASGPRPRFRYVVRQVHESDAPDSARPSPMPMRSTGRAMIVGEAFGYSLVPSAWIYSHGSLTIPLQDLMPRGHPMDLARTPGGDQQPRADSYRVGRLREHRRQCAPDANVRLTRGR